MHGNRYMKIFADKGLTNFFFAPEILKSFRETEKNNKNLEFDLGQNPLEIIHGPFFVTKIATNKILRFFCNYQQLTYSMHYDV